MRNYSSTAVATTLASAISSSDTSMTLAAATGLPSVPFTLVIEPDTAYEEIVTVTARSGTSVSAMSRGQESTTARSHAAGSVVKHMVTGRDLQDVQDHIANTTTAHGVTGAVVGTTNSQTLTNKAISGSANTLTNIAQSSVTNLVTDLSNKSAVGHTHTLANVTDITASAAEVNILDGVTSSTTELNKLTGVTTTTAQLNYLNTATSNIQTQLDAKAPLANPTFTTGITFEGATNDTFETTLTVVDPTADRTITLPNATGTVALTSDIPTITTAYASVYRSTGSTTTDTVLSYPNENADTNSFHDNTTNNSRITIPSGLGGKYRVSASVTAYYNGADSSFKAHLRKNGTKVDGTDVSGIANITYGTTGGNIDTIITLAAADYLEVYVDVTTSGAGIGFYSTFNVQYLGA